MTDSDILNLPSTPKDFQIIGKLGEGSFSRVFKVKRVSDNQMYLIFYYEKIIYLFILLQVMRWNK